MAPEPEGSSPYSQKLATCPYPEPTGSILHPQPISLIYILNVSCHLRMSWSSKWSFSFWPSHRNLLHFSVLPNACHMARPPHSPWSDLPNDIWGWVQNMKLLIVQLPKLFLLFHSSLFQEFSLGPWSEKPSVYVLPLMWEPKFHTHTKTTGRIMVLYILTFIFLESSSCNFDLLLLFPNIWTLSHLQRTYSLSLFCDFVLLS
jgi:hypothetical protein